MQEVDEKTSYDAFPRSEYMKKFKGRAVKPGHYPAPDRCLLEMVNTQLMVRDMQFTIYLIMVYSFHHLYISKCWPDALATLRHILKV